MQIDSDKHYNNLIKYDIKDIRMQCNNIILNKINTFLTEYNIITKIDDLHYTFV